MSQVRYGILLPAVFAEHDRRGELAVDHGTGLPVTYASAYNARRGMRRTMPSWMPPGQVVKLHVYDADDPENPAKNGMPSFVVENV